MALNRAPSSQPAHVDRAPDPRLTGTGIHPSLLDTIGRTPLVHLARLSAAEALTPVLAMKLESANPGGSSKDRSALAMIRAAEAAGRLRPGGTVIETTAGNTGVSLALVAAQLGYECVMVVADDVSREKLDLLRSLGAEVISCPAALPASDPGSYQSVLDRVTRERGAFRPYPFDNPANPQGHELTTGAEIWEQTSGRVTHFVAGVGTGGTVMGVARALKARNPRIRVIAADPEGAVFSGGPGRPNLVDGEGEDMFHAWSAPRARTPGTQAPVVRTGPVLPASWDPDLIDEVLPISDAESFAVARQAARLEGTVLGPSGGLALAAALRVARRAGPDDVVVVVNPDSGRGRVGQLYDDQWMASIGFLRQEEKDVGSLLDARVRVDPCLPELLYVSPQERVRDVIDLMRSTAVSQLPVCRNSPPFALAEVVGAVDELVLMGHVARDPAVLDQPVESVMGPALPTIGAGQPVGRAIDLLSTSPALMVLSGGRPRGILTRTDILEVMEWSAL